ncbi:MAG: vancomycin high temperature exclusion protein [Flammeovirgaceae bacterium]
MIRKSTKKLIKLTGWITVAVVLCLVVVNVWVVISTRNRVSANYKNLPDSSVVLVLGTSSKLTGGSPNPYFEDRIQAAAKLFKLGKARQFLLSGDNRTKYYNEPMEMRKALIKAGVPAKSITLDYAGLRTLDSIVRCKEIFGQNKVVIVTQPFHCYRAVFISNFYEMDVVAWHTNTQIAGSNKLQFREYFARAKAVLDLYIFKTTPRHLGERQELTI